VKRAHDELVHTGARPRRMTRSGVAALTPTERRVAALAAEGRTNREIAEALFVTPKTIEMHLGNAFRKLRIEGRGQLAGLLTGS
jgi:DNA-binding CsgD family transcriptional regulator